MTTENLVCPITKLFLCDPVVAEDGNVYEYMAIVNWLKTKDISPKTNQKMGRTLMRVNTMRLIVAEYLEKHPEDKQNQFIVKKPFYLFEKEFFEIIKNKQYEKIKDFTNFELNYEIGKETLIEVVAKNCPADCTIHVINNSIDYDTEDRRHLRPIHVVIKHSTPEVIKHLMAKDISLECEDHIGNRPIDYLITNYPNDSEMIKFFLEKNVSINHTNKQGCRIVHNVVSTGNLRLLKLLLAYGLELNSTGAKSPQINTRSANVSANVIANTGILNMLQYSFKYSPSFELINFMIENETNLETDIDPKMTCEQLIYQNGQLNKKEKQQLVFNYLKKILSKPVVDEKYFDHAHENGFDIITIK